MKNNDELVSIIIPVYNVEKYVYKCINSLINQTYKKIEIIVINDGTQDNSIDEIKKLEDNRIRIINQINKGVSSARNNGLKHAKGKYIMFVDADDYVTKDYVEYLYNLISINKADFAFTTNLFQSKYDNQISQDKIEIVDNITATGILLSPDVVVGCYNKIYSKKLIDKNKLEFLENLFYGEGLSFIIRMCNISKKIVIGKRKILYYRKNNIDSATTKYNNKKYHNGIKSLELLAKTINLKNEYINSMYQLHLATFYLGAISKMIENNKKKEYIQDYKKWKKELNKRIPFILKNKYIKIYRKIMLVIGNISPALIALLNKKRSKNIINRSID